MNYVIGLAPVALLVTFFLFRKKLFNTTPTIKEPDSNKELFDFIRYQLSFHPQLLRLGVMSEFIIQNQDRITEETVENYLTTLEAFSEDVVLKYYEKTGNDFFQDMEENIDFYKNNPDHADAIKQNILERMAYIMRNTNIKQQIDNWNESVTNDE
jgi:hypothetical protein